jgi:hypothetical protein
MERYSDRCVCYSVIPRILRLSIVRSSFFGIGFKKIYMRKYFIFFAHSSLDNNGTGGNTFIGRGTGMTYR